MRMEMFKSLIFCRASEGKGYDLLVLVGVKKGKVKLASQKGVDVVLKGELYVSGRHLIFGIPDATVRLLWTPFGGAQFCLKHEKGKEWVLEVCGNLKRKGDGALQVKQRGVKVTIEGELVQAVSSAVGGGER